MAVLPDAEALLVAKATAACLRIMADRLALHLLEFTADDDYSRGLVEGVDLAVSILREAADTTDDDAANL